MAHWRPPRGQSALRQMCRRPRRMLSGHRAATADRDLSWLKNRPTNAIMGPMDEAQAAVPFALLAAGKTDVGQKRDHNEDTILLRPDLGLFLLADGAGGHNAGEVASALATTPIANFFEAPAKATRRKPEVDQLICSRPPRRAGGSL